MSHVNNHREHKGYREKRHSSVLWYEKNNELDELTPLEFVLVRTSSLFKSLYSEEVIQTGTRMPRIARIGTDTIIRVRLSDPFFSVNDINRKINDQWLFYPVIEHGGGAMSMEFERILDASVAARGWRNLFGDGIATEKIVTITFHVEDHHRRQRLSRMTETFQDREIAGTDRLLHLSTF